MPELILVVVAAGVLLLDTFAMHERSRTLAWLSLSGIALAFTYALDLWGGPAVYGFSNMVVSDNFAVFLKFVILIAAGLTILFSASYLEKEELEHGEYYGLLLFAAVGMMLLAAATNFVTIFLGLETLSIALYVLAGFARGNAKSDESALKYFLLGAFATGFLVYGMALIFGATGTLDLSALSGIVIHVGIMQNPMLYAGVGLLLVGLAFKIALVPFHVWTPDVYEGAPTTVTAFMSVGTKAAALVALSRVFLSGLSGIAPQWIGLLWALAVLSMFAGNVVAIAQTNLKRMLGYSSIAHAGYLVIGVVAASNLGISSIAFYLLAYTFMNLGAFGVILYLERRGENLTLNDYAGLSSRFPLAAALMALFMFGLAGIPPTAGFVAKFYIFSAAIQAGYVGLAIIGVLTSVIGAYFYLRVIVYMYMRPAEGEMTPPVRSYGTATALVIAAVMTILLGTIPTPTLDMVRQIVLPGT